MPVLFNDLTTFTACALIIAGAQLIYATVGFGAGMFSISLLALVLPDLAGSVATLLLLTFITEVWVLIRHWRQARAKLLLGIIPTMAIGLYIGTHILACADVSGLKRGLGAVVALAGIWFLYQHLKPHPHINTQQTPDNATHTATKWPRLTWISIPVGLLSGVLGGMFGTGGPPVIIYLTAFGLNKGAFRATLLWYFLIMSLIRAGTYLEAGLLNTQILYASLWLLPPSIIGILIGLTLHHRLTERRFALLVCILLTLLGTLLLAGAGK